MASIVTALFGFLLIPAALAACVWLEKWAGSGDSLSEPTESD